MRFQKKLVLLLLAAGLTTAAQAQQTVRYQVGKARYTKVQLDSLVAVREQLIRAKMPDFQFVAQTISTETRGDTLLHQMKLMAGNAAVIANMAGYQKFVGQLLPPFELRTLAGQIMRSADLRGQPLIINMCFTSCPPCVAEMPALNQFKAENPGANYVSMTYESPAKVTEFLKKHPFSFTHIPDAKAYCEQFTTSYPLTIFVDKSGVVQRINQGLPIRYDAANKRPGTEADMTGFREAWQAIR
ncbi:TlpA family protein disulfide reductase [Hymenobacter terrestris]|uniref:TlpA family protein disulfide reductase n=1 Tax=Hymenobacter terrestris TaxID=2748310 RepID=A0ABX2Q6R7_9BACT|nr:TlpA disulfide reductase family protein [Hymenobacter terrestris]NVO86661.1 TlpA family protein disulfide reductase [Hymenobacter terrestris]